MRVVGSLKGRVALWSGTIFFLLFIAAFSLVVAIDRQNSRRDLEVALYAQAESLATYYASSGRLDYPELQHLEADRPLPVWLRVVGDGGVIASTPGLPDLPLPDPFEPPTERLETWSSGDGIDLAFVQHGVWNYPGETVEAITSLEVLVARSRKLKIALSLAGLLLIPLAALGGWIVASRALAPVEDLVSSIRALDLDSLEDRLHAPGAVAELTALKEEFNRLLDRLEASVGAMRRFTADASHELRTPITILRTGLEVALRKERTAEQYREVLAENLAEISRVQRIVNSLLTLARIQSNSEPVIAEEGLDFSAVVSETVEAAVPTARQKEITLKSDIAEGVELQGDKDLLHLMVLNLLDNALKFTPPRKVINISLAADNGRARLRVHDQGPGVPPEDRDKIFDRFFRGQGAGSTSSGAGGLGLSVVSWVTQGHGGRIRLVESEEPGAIFEVDLPTTPSPGS